jgi:hypothetical protein
MTAHFLLPRLAVLSLCWLVIAAMICPHFSITPACSREATKACVQQFNFYDISQGIPNVLKQGSIPVPTGAHGLVKGISGTTESILFNPGRHRVAVSAQTPDGSESDLRKWLSGSARSRDRGSIP